MKKFLTVILAALMVLSVAACGETETKAPETKATEADTTAAPTETEAEPTEPETEKAVDPNAVATAPSAPSYIFDHTPTTDELRQTVITAMHDALSVQWYSPQAFDYHKTGAASAKHYQFEAMQHYAGLPYTNAQRTIWGMLEYLDENGRLDTERVIADSGYSTLGDAVNHTIGNTCTGGTGWAYLSCCASISGQLSASFCVEDFGFLRVGSYTYSEGLQSFRNETTEAICNKNGREVMYASYAEALPGDLMVTDKEAAGADHSTMVLENHVEKKADGTVDPEASYIVIQDQHTGFFNDVDENGGSLKYIGHTGVNAVKRSYTEWFNLWYLPCTAAELIGKTAYTVPECSLKTEATDLESIHKNYVTSNYPQTVIKAVAIVNGKEQTLQMIQHDRVEVGNKTAYNTSTTKLYTAVKKAEIPEGTKAEIRATLSNGQVFTVGTITK